MKIVRNDYNNDFKIIRLNQLEPRSFFVDFSSKKVVDNNVLTKRYNSDKIVCLNGNWDYKFYNNPNELPNEFDTDNIKFDTIDVPSCIQYRGYSYPAYINLKYPFRFNAPYVPTTKPVGLYFSLLDGIKKAKKDEYNHISIYQKEIEINDLNKNYILTFLGVCSCFELYINSSFVGYAEESHNMHEFDINKYIVAGKNKIVVIVHRWCNGTYLECQDMFRNTGIFRDVLLRVNNKIDIFDINIDTKYHDGLYDLLVDVTLNNKVNENVLLTLSGRDLKLEGKDSTTDGRLHYEFKDLKVVEWNAEKPETYNLEIEINGSYVNNIVGFKHIEIEDGIFYFNNQVLKIKGVNHHDTSPINGFTMTSDDLFKDVKNAKDYNFNTFRTSHYPPDPTLIELATIYGLYIIEECDLETHGAMISKFPFNMDYFSKNKKWEKHYLSRIEKLYQRDKNNKTPIILYSLGNECGAGVNTNKQYEYLKKVTDIPVHLESAIRTKIEAYDVAGEMYPTTSHVKEVGNLESKHQKENDRPFILCEYAHAMGVGPGNIEEYMDLFYAYPNIMGGCIWEMNDHAVLKDGKYLYGGDNGEWLHDSNFCVDGLFYPDRTPSTGAYIARHAYRPVRFYFENNTFYAFNTNNFTNLNEYIITYAFNDGKENKIKIDCLPLKDKELDISIPEIVGINYVNFKVYKNDKLVDESQIIIKDEYSKGSPIEKLPNYIHVNNGHIEIDSIKESSPYTLIYRANMDNDKHNFFFKTMVDFYNEKENIINVFQDENKIVIETIISFKKGSIKVIDEYTGIQDGVHVKTILKPLTFKGYLPRFSKSFILDKSFDTLTYFGHELESYIDMYEHSKVGTFTKKVLDMVEPNIKPQDSGNRFNSKYVTFNNGKGNITFTSINSNFELAVKPYSDKYLTTMKHQEDATYDATYVTLSLFEQGVGTGSCGPETLPIHKFKLDKEYTFEFEITIKK